MKTKKIILKLLYTFLALIMIITVLASCSSSTTSEAGPYPIYAEESVEVAQKDTAYESSTSDTKLAGEPGPEQVTGTYDNSGRKIVYTAYLSLESEEYGKAVESSMSIIEKYEGYIESSSRTGSLGTDETTPKNNRLRTYTSVLRIPAKNYRATVKELEEQGNVIYLNEESTDLSLQYSDSEIRKKTLEVEAERVLFLMEKATRMEDIITLEARLTEIRYDIETMERIIRDIDANVDYSTIYFTIEEVKEYSPEPKDELSFLKRISLGFTDSLVSIKILFEDIIVGIISNLPYILIFIVLVVIILLIIKRVIKRIKKEYKDKDILKPVVSKVKGEKQEYLEPKKAEDTKEKDIKKED